MFGVYYKTPYICTRNAEIAQLVEHNLAKVRVASSSLVFRSKREISLRWFLFFCALTENNSWCQRKKSAKSILFVRHSVYLPRKIIKTDLHENL